MGYKRKSHIFLSACLVFFAGCETSATSLLDGSTESRYGVYAIKNVSVIPMTPEGQILHNVNVVVADKKILSTNDVIPDKAVTIDGTGKWLIPGLIEMHVHTIADINYGLPGPTVGATFFFDTQDVMTPFIANGITTIFDLDARVDHFAQRNEITRGDVIGPRMALAKLLNGGDDVKNVNTESEGRQAVRSAKAEGYQFIKTYADLNAETFLAIVDEAEKQELKVIGHIPYAFRGRTEDAFVPHFSMVAHAEEFAKQSEDFSDEDISHFTKIAKDNGIWLTPTLITMVRIAGQTLSLDPVRDLDALQYMHPLMQDKWLSANNFYREGNQKLADRRNQTVDFNARLVKAFNEAGIPIVAGADSVGSGIIPGFSFHDELELLVDAGLTPEQTLNSATRLPAVWLGIEDKVGTVEAGKYADLVLLDANPLEDIKNARQIAGVFVNGQWLDKLTIDAMLGDLSARNAAYEKKKYIWNKRRELGD